MYWCQGQVAFIADEAYVIAIQAKRISASGTGWPDVAIGLQKKEARRNWLIQSFNFCTLELVSQTMATEYIYL